MVNEREKRDSNFMYVMIEFPHIHYEGMEYSVIYFEMVREGSWYKYALLHLSETDLGPSTFSQVKYEYVGNG